MNYTEIKGKFGFWSVAGQIIRLLLTLPIPCFFIFIFIKVLITEPLTFKDFLIASTFLWFGLFFILLYTYLFKIIMIKGDSFIIKYIVRKDVCVNLNEIEYYEGFFDTRYGKQRQLVIIHNNIVITRIGKRELKNYNDFHEFFKKNNSINTEFKNEKIPSVLIYYFAILILIAFTIAIVSSINVF